MIERFLQQTTFTSQQDFIDNLKINVPDNFNFGYDVVDAWAAEQPDKPALLWTNDKGEHRQFSFGDMKRYTDMTASYFQSLGIGRGDMVMLILKRRYEFWFSIVALHKLGAVVIPATHLLTKKDIVYRCNAADIKMIVCAGETVTTDHITAAMPQSPSVKRLVSVGPEIPEGYEDFHKGIEAAAPFVKPEYPNTNDDISLMYFTSGTTGEPKMVAHDFTYPLGHIVTGYIWHNLKPDSLHLTIADTGWGKAVWGKLYGQWIAGANVFVYDHEKFTPADILQKIQDYHVTSLCAPPTIFRFLIHEDLTKYDLSHLEYCTIAGEALNPAVFDTFKKLTGIRLMEGFGQTETTLTVATMPWMEPKPGSMGLPTRNTTWISSTPKAVPSKPASRDRSSSVPTRASPSACSRNTTAPPSAPVKPGTTASTTRATWPGKTRTATCGSWGVRTTSSRAQATASVRSKWKAH